MPTFKSLIWGPSCDGLDKVRAKILTEFAAELLKNNFLQISQDLRLPNLNRGDLIGFPNMGAYTVPIASAFNGFPLPRTLYYRAI